MKKIKELLCYLLGHKWKFNRPCGAASKRICERCNKKQYKLWDDYVGPYYDTNDFDNEKLSDIDLCKNWHK